MAKQKGVVQPVGFSKKAVKKKEKRDTKRKGRGKGSKHG